jgi:hypothetical protein
MPLVGFEPTIAVFERVKTIIPRGHCDRRLTNQLTTKNRQINNYATTWSRAVVLNLSRNLDKMWEPQRLTKLWASKGLLQG